MTEQKVEYGFTVKGYRRGLSGITIFTLFIPDSEVVYNGFDYKFELMFDATIFSVERSWRNIK